MVGISLLTLVPEVVGGSETYSRELVRALARVGELRYRVILPRIAPEAGGGLPATVARGYRASATMPGRAAAMARAALFPRGLRRELDLESLAAIHFPLTVMLPSARSPAAVVTVHDLQHEIHPRFFSRAELAYRRLAYRHAARRSTLVIVPSEFVRASVVNHLGVSPERVRTILHGLDHDRFAPAERQRRPFLLYPANRWRHKNHDRLLEAFALVRRERPELRLVLTGTGHEGKAVAEGVDVRGRVSPGELLELYRTAAALVFPSLYEGFGYPPLEAMACGCPVACSEAGSLPEIVGDAAVLFDPTSTEAVAEGIERVLSDEGRAERGIERARSFTWEASALAHEQVYREALDARA